MKRYFFAITTALIIGVSLFCFSIVPQIAGTQEAIINEISSSNVGDMNYFEPESMLEYIKRVCYFQCVLVIILNLILIEFAASGGILRHKKRAIVYSLLTMLFSLNFVVFLLAGVNIIALIIMKRKDEEDFPKEVVPVEPLECIKSSKEDKYRAIELVLIYIIFHFGFPTVLQTLETMDIPQMLFAIMVLACSIVGDIIVFICAINIFKDELREGWKAFKNNSEGYRRLLAKFVLLSFACLITLNITRLILTGEEFTSNQASLNELPLVYVAVLATLWAPIVEELVFRGVFRRFISNKIAFIITSGVVFGILHAIGGTNVILSALPYVGLGICLSTAYAKSNNIWMNIFMHSINNAVGVVAIYLLFGM